MTNFGNSTPLAGYICARVGLDGPRCRVHPGVLGVAQVGTEEIRAGDEVVSNGSHVWFTFSWSDSYL